MVTQQSQRIYLNILGYRTKDIETRIGYFASSTDCSNQSQKNTNIFVATIENGENFVFGCISFFLFLFSTQNQLPQINIKITILVFLKNLVINFGILDLRNT